MQLQNQKPDSQQKPSPDSTRSAPGPGGSVLAKVGAKNLLIAGAVVATVLAGSAFYTAPLSRGELSSVTREQAEFALKELQMSPEAVAGVLRDADAGKIKLSSFVLTTDSPTSVAVQIGSFAATVPVNPQMPARVVIPLPGGNGQLLVITEAPNVVAHFRNGRRAIETKDMSGFSEHIGVFQ